jgi:hypothetical protein
MSSRTHRFGMKIYAHISCKKTLYVYAWLYTLSRTQQTDVSNTVSGHSVACVSNNEKQVTVENEHYAWSMFQLRVYTWNFFAGRNACQSKFQINNLEDKFQRGRCSSPTWQSCNQHSALISVIAFRVLRDRKRNRACISMNKYTNQGSIIYMYTYIKSNISC